MYLTINKLFIFLLATSTLYPAARINPEIDAHGHETNENKSIDCPKILTDNENLLIDAASDREKTEIVKNLIKAGVNVNSTGENGCTALMAAADNGNLQIVRFLIKSKANVNTTNNDGDTALMFAVGQEKIKIVELLIESGVDVNATNSDGTTALMSAVDCYFKKIVKILLQAGTHIDIVDTYGNKALDYAYMMKLSDSNSDDAESITYEKNSKEKIAQIIQAEPERRVVVIKKFIENNKKWINDKFGVKISEYTSGQLIIDISNIIAGYAIEYTDLPLKYRLGS